MVNPKAASKHLHKGLLDLRRLILAKQITPERYTEMVKELIESCEKEAGIYESQKDYEHTHPA